MVRRSALACFLLFALSAYSAHADRAYISNQEADGSVPIIDTTNAQDIATIGPYSANGPSIDASVVDAPKLTVIKRVFGQTPWGVVLEPTPASPTRS